MKSITLEKLKTQRTKLDARIQSLEARTKTSERKKEVRKKILVGSYYLDQAHQNNTMEEIKNLMSTYLKRNSDRKLFDLLELPDEKNERNEK